MPEMSFPVGPATQAEIYVGSADDLPLDPDEWEARAKAVLEPGPFDYIAGGAGGDSTMQANRDAFARWRLRPAMLAGNQQRDLHVNVLGTSSPTPFFLAPVGVLSAARPDGDLAVARAAAAAGVPWVVSTAASTPMETIAATMGTAPRWYQLYWVNDREVVASLVHRGGGRRLRRDRPDPRYIAAGVARSRSPQPVPALHPRRGHRPVHQRPGVPLAALGLAGR